MDNTKYSWIPHPGPQYEALTRQEFEILFGGARGGGKTDAGIYWVTRPAQDNPAYRALVIRRNSDDLSDWVDRVQQKFAQSGVKIAYRPPEITFPNGAIIKTGHLKDEQAYTKYVGHEYHRILIEELTQIPDEKRYLQLIASCRSTKPGLIPQVFCTTNPGGLGHQWVKQRFIDIAPPMTSVEDHISKRHRIFIPSKVEDNPTLMKVDPSYIQFLEGLKNTDIELWKAWRLGDWDTFAGQFFKEFKRGFHVCKPFLPSRTNVLIGGLDWGYNAPFCLSLSEVSRVTLQNGVMFYRVKTFLEVYGTGKTPKEWTEVIKERLKFYNLTIENIAWIQADPSIFNKGTDGSVSIRDQFIKADDRFYNLKAGSNDRVAGWAQMHNWLSNAPDGLPYWQISENCINGIKEIGSAVYNESKIEDLDAEFDHFLDQMRYCLKALKWLDAGKIGGVAQYNPNVSNRPVALRVIRDEQVSNLIEAFANPNQLSTSGVGGILHD